MDMNKITILDKEFEVGDMVEVNWEYKADGSKTVTVGYIAKRSLLQEYPDLLEIFSHNDYNYNPSKEIDGFWGNLELSIGRIKDIKKLVYEQ